uniref:Ig-like domain-containing protein n=1 Tax=Myripristis murdjan TaxID=586833 RepID=A0A667Z2D2_9TELE
GILLYFYFGRILRPIVVIVGDDVILPCHLESAMDAVAMTVEWARPDLEPRFVHVWRDGINLLSHQHPSYKGRTSLFMDKLKHGDFSLTLSRVKLSDEGRYRCFIPLLGRETFVNLVVGAASSPVIHTSKSSSGVVLECESKGWYPEPELFWLDAEGKLLSAGAPETVRGPDGLYTVSSRVTVEKSHGNSFTFSYKCHALLCFIISDDFNLSSPAVPVAISLSAVFLCVVTVVFVVWKWRRNKISESQIHFSPPFFMSCFSYSASIEAV